MRMSCQASEDETGQRFSPSMRSLRARQAADFIVAPSIFALRTASTSIAPRVPMADGVLRLAQGSPRCSRPPPRERGQGLAGIHPGDKLGPGTDGKPWRYSESPAGLEVKGVRLCLPVIPQPGALRTRRDWRFVRCRPAG